MLAKTPSNDLFTYVNHDLQPLALHAANHPRDVADLTNIERSPMEIVFQSPPCVLFARTASEQLAEKGALNVR